LTRHQLDIEGLRQLRQWVDQQTPQPRDHPASRRSFSPPPQIPG
jgi:hypothetical protein